MRRRLLLVVALLGLSVALEGAAGQEWPNRSSEDWADSPEAYFLTSQELAEWRALDSRAERDAFRERYWLKRDPTPGTDRNEFRENVLARIRTADQRFRIERTPGSRTARGFVFVVLGTPARVFDRHAPLPTRLVPEPLGFPEGNETISEWVYDPQRTPRILDLLGLPRLQVELIVEPGRRIDEIQNPGQFHKLRETVARKSIVNPDLIPPARESAPDAAVLALPRLTLEPAVVSPLERAPFSSRTGDAVFGNATVWRQTGEPETLVWFSLPPAPSGHKRRLHARIREESDGHDVAALSEDATRSDAFSSASADEVLLRKFSLPPGEYRASFAVTQDGAVAPIASAATKLSVPELSAGFAVSSLILTRGLGARDPADRSSPFAIGPTLVPPRADATFSKKERLWFFVETANPTDAAAVNLEVRLRRGTETVGEMPPFAAGLRPIAPGRFVCGHEVHLDGLAPGDYRLYVIVREKATPKEANDPELVRAADFRLTE